MNALYDLLRKQPFLSVERMMIMIIKKHQVICKINTDNMSPVNMFMYVRRAETVYLQLPNHKRAYDEFEKEFWKKKPKRACLKIKKNFVKKKAQKIYNCIVTKEITKKFALY